MPLCPQACKCDGLNPRVVPRLVPRSSLLRRKYRLMFTVKPPAIHAAPLEVHTVLIAAGGNF